MGGNFSFLKDNDGTESKKTSAGEDEQKNNTD